jgi:hypothetical protein
MAKNQEKINKEIERQQKIASIKAEQDAIKRA